MQNAAATLFKLDFKQDVFLFLGAIYFTLLLYWIFALKLGSDRIWTAFSVMAGLAFAFAATQEWGLPLAGTAVPLGLCISMALIHPSAAASLLASSLFLRPWELVAEDPFLGILPRLSITLCLAHLFLHYAQTRRIDFKHTQVARILLLFTGWAFVTTLFSSDPSASQSEFYDGFLKSLVLFLMLLQMIRTRESLRLMFGTLFISFLSVAGISEYNSLRLGSLLEVPDFRLVGFGAFANSNDIAALMVWILPFAVFLMIRKSENLFHRSLGFVLTFSALSAVFLSKSRGAVLGVASMIALFFFLRMGRKAIVPLVIGGLLLAIPTTILVFNRRTEDLAGSSAGRKTFLKAGLRMGIKNPIFGVGYGAYPQSLQAYSTESLEESTQMTAHNSWVLVFAELGLIGLLLFTAVFLTSGFSAWKIYPTSPEYLLALGGYSVTIFFLSHSYLIYPSLLFALIEVARSLEAAEAPC